MSRKKLTIDHFGEDITVEIDQVKEGEHVTHRGKTIIVGQEFDVYLLGTFIGKVRRSMATRERRTPGRTYVNARWQSPAWQRARPDVYPTWLENDSRASCIRSLIDLSQRLPR